MPSGDRDLNKIVDFVMSFRTAGRELIARLDQKFKDMGSELWLTAQIHPTTRTQHRLLGVACDRVLKSIEDQIEGYMIATHHRDLFERFGTDGRRALVELLLTDEIDSVKKMALKDFPEGSDAGLLRTHMRDTYYLEDLASIGWAGRTTKTTLKNYGDYRTGVLEIARQVIASMQPS